MDHLDTSQALIHETLDEQKPNVEVTSIHRQNFLLATRPHKDLYTSDSTYLSYQTSSPLPWVISSSRLDHPPQILELYFCCVHRTLTTVTRSQSISDHSSLLHSLWYDLRTKDGRFSYLKPPNWRPTSSAIVLQKVSSQYWNGNYYCKRTLSAASDHLNSP